MNIFIDESGSFVNSTEDGSWNTVVAYASPESDGRKMKLVLNNLKKKCTVTSSTEIKLKHIAEDDYIDFLKNLYSLNGVLFSVVTDASHNHLNDISQHQNKQVKSILLHLDKMEYEGGKIAIQHLAEQLQQLSPQLYAQLHCQVTLMFTTVNHLILYTVQRNPNALSKFRWRIDQKNISKNDFEDAFEKITPILLQTRSLDEPLIMINGWDYRALKPYMYNNGEVPSYLKDVYGLDVESGLNIQKIVREDIKFEDSKKSIGIQIADLLASGLRRCLRCGFKRNNEVAFFLAKLMLQAMNSKPPLNIIAFKEGVVTNESTIEIIKIMTKNCKKMIRKS